MWKEAVLKNGKELDGDEKWNIGIHALEQAGDLEAAKR